MLNAVEKLEAAGPTLPFPHQSGVQGGEKLRELRPRAGRSPWRGFYRRIGDMFVVAAVGPEAASDRRGFDRATADAVSRLETIQAEGDAP